MKKLSFLALIISLYATTLFGQCQVTHLNGSMTINGTLVTVSSSGIVDSNAVYCSTTLPYFIGYSYTSGSSGNGSYTFNFSPPVPSATLNFSGISSTAGHEEEVQIDVNGVHFPIAVAGSPNGCDPLAVLTPQGNIAACSGCGASGWMGTTISGSISSLTVEDTVIIGQPAGAIFSLFICNGNGVAGFASSDTLVCEKSCLDFYDMSTNTPTSWQWFFPNAQPDTSTLQNPTGICYNSYGTFDVTLISCNPGSCDTLSLPGFITIFQNPPQPVISFSNDTLYCSGQASSYQWYFNSAIMPGSTGTFLVNLQPGTYYCLVTDSNDCPASSNVFVWTGIQETDFQNSAITYENPVSDLLNIHFNIPLPNATFSLYDISGRKSSEKTITKNTSDEMSIDVSALSPGNYFLKISTGGKRTFFQGW